jgi:uncharacterized protein YdeI (YjbR/CyaY-like superfamily)
MKHAANSTVGTFLAKTKSWQPEFEALRGILLASPLTEDFKWGWPCYTLDDRNVVLMHGFKHYCALLFLKGALLKDPKKILVQQTENVQAARHLRFTDVKDIIKMKSTIKAYLLEAIAIEKAGLKVKLKKTSAFKLPVEFKKKLAAAPALKKAFEALTPGRQRAYLLHFANAKQSATREARIAKCAPMILKGKGLND